MTPEQRRDYMRKWRERNRERVNAYARSYVKNGHQAWRDDDTHPAHGKYTTYANGCRCARCTEAWRVHLSEYRRIRREARQDG